MARSSKLDALEKFRFTVEFDGLTRAGFHDITSPKMTVNKGTYREGNAPDNMQLFAGLAQCEDVVMSRGVTTSQDFYDWALKVFDLSKVKDGQPNVQKNDVVPLGADTEYRKTLTITLWNRAGEKAKQWVLHNAFPINFQPSSDMSATEDGEKAMEQLTVGYESFEETLP